ncbi:MAG TPA: hypothetical protein VFN35_06145, partial [Ktedonobacteraceae bacterium]|nr:hypothetical protein [Ktedonobacteraceae bacterium]
LVRQHGLRLSLGISLSFVHQAERWDPALLDLFRDLVAEENVELIGVDPYHSLHSLLDLPAFVLRMRWMVEEMKRLFGKRPVVTDTTELGMSTGIYNALDAAGFRGALMDGVPRIMQWRSSNYLYRSGIGEPCVAESKPLARSRRGVAKTLDPDRQGPPYTTDTPAQSSPYLLTRHVGLSTDISQRFSDSSWPSYPLFADTYASWIERVEGDFALLGWDFEIFGERQSHSTGIFEFMQDLPGALARRGVATRHPSELIDRFSGERAYGLPLPLRPATWSSSLNPEICFDAEEQKDLVQLMLDVYNMARLTEQPELLDLALWLSQSDNLRLVQWPGPQLVPSVTPNDWWRLGLSGLLREQKQVYLNVLHAMEAYLPARLMRKNLSASAAIAQSTEAVQVEAEEISPAQASGSLLANKEPEEGKTSKTEKSSAGAEKTPRRKSSPRA